MTFNPDSDISGGRVSSRGRSGAIVAGAGGLGAIALFLLSQFLGVDLTSLTGLTGTSTSQEQVGDDSALASCQTGADANAKVECRMKGAAASLEAYWEAQAPELGVDYTPPAAFQLFSGQTQTGCGAASAASGPFYCPPDQTIYLDTAFFDQLRSQFGTSGGSLAELYVVAHEWGHHVQNLAGVLESTHDGQTGPGSATVRTELQADCFAGAWAYAAQTVPDANGVPFLKKISASEYADAMDAARAVGDDTIQSEMRGQVIQSEFTHGSSKQRQRWFQTGFQQGATACNTFDVPTGQL
ncbi:MAG TPA: neutral zinc metallopeptidase [Candidatus Lumbricidophila sp.]|nr:neutral zinc metallopeptidase [Candidatus Lumbricidophila sp.]